MRILLLHSKVKKKLTEQEQVANVSIKNPGIHRVLSSEYIGNSSSHFASSDHISNSSEIFRSSDNITQSSSKFKSSDDILTYLKNHPDYQKTPSSELEAILAIVASSLAVAGGVVALFVVSGGSATPVILGTSLLIGAGITGGQNAISGIIHKNFSLEDFAKTIATNSVLTLITFGSGYAAGGLSGLALRGTNLTERTIKTIGTISGALVSSGARTGTYLVITRVEDKPVEAMELVLEGVMGAVEGGFAGYLGAKAFPKLKTPSDVLPVELVEEALVVEEVKAPKGISSDPLKYLDEDGRPIRILFDKRTKAPSDPLKYLDADGRPIRILFDQQTVIEILPHPDIGYDLGLIRGWQIINPDGKLVGGAGLVHILSKHPDVVELLGFTKQEIETALKEVDQVISPMIKKISEAFIKILEKEPHGVIPSVRDSTTYVWKCGEKLNEKFIQVSVSTEEWNFGTRNIIQANIVKPSTKIIKWDLVKRVGFEEVKEA